MIKFRSFDSENVWQEIELVHRLVAVDLTEPYTVAVYLYFLKNWPELAIFAYANDDPKDVVGVIVGRLRCHNKVRMRGYVAMLAVQEKWRGQGIAKQLISKQIAAFKAGGADEVALEAECTNKAAVHLYESHGFLRTSRMYRYYMGTHDAFSLVLPLTKRALVPEGMLDPCKCTLVDKY